MSGQPAGALGQQLFQLVVADEIMLLVVEDGHQHIEMRQQFGERLGCPDSDGKIGTLSPFGKLLVERMARRFDVITERLEEAVQEAFAAADRQHVEPSRERQRRDRQFRPVVAPALHRRAKHLGDRDAHERRGHKRPVIDVLAKQRMVARASAANHADRIDIEQQAGRASPRRRFRVEDVRFAEAQLEALEPRGVLVQQETQIRRGLLGCGNREQHDRGGDSRLKREVRRPNQEYQGIEHRAQVFRAVAIAKVTVCGTMSGMNGSCFHSRSL